MPRTRRKHIPAPRAVILLALAAIAIFGGGQLFAKVRSDGGALFLARFGVGDRQRIETIVGREISRGLAAVGVTDDSLHESTRDGRPAKRWRVGLPPGTSLLQTNHAITHCVEKVGAVVLDGRERQDRDGRLSVVLVIGLPRQPTHEVVLEAAAEDEGGQREPATMALVVFGFGDDPESARAHFDLPVRFAAALIPGARWSPGLFRAARQKNREVVLRLPLEPLNYPNPNPGPGTILVTMGAGRATGLLRRYLDQAGPVTAVSNYMGSLAMQDVPLMTALFKELRRQKLPFMQVGRVPGSMCEDLAADLGVAYEEPDLIFDPEKWKAHPRELRREWGRVLHRAREQRHLIVWIRASSFALEWLPRATDSKQLDGVNLIPLSAAIRGPVPL